MYGAIAELSCSCSCVYAVRCTPYVQLCLLCIATNVYRGIFRFRFFSHFTFGIVVRFLYVSRCYFPHCTAYTLDIKHHYGNGMCVCVCVCVRRDGDGVRESSGMSYMSSSKCNTYISKTYFYFRHSIFRHVHMYNGTNAKFVIVVALAATAAAGSDAISCGRNTRFLAVRITNLSNNFRK